MLETALEMEHLDVDEVNRLLLVVNNAENSLPDMVDRKGLALFYEYHARLLLMQDESGSSALSYFEKSIQMS